MADKFDDLNEWATSRVPSTKCLTCRDDAVCDIIREYLRLVQCGDARRSLAAFHAWLCSQRGYELSYAALRNHVVRCEGGSVA